MTLVLPPCNQIAGLKLSCDKKVVPTTRACADGQTGYRRRKLVQNHMIVRSNYTIHIHMLTQHNQEMARFVNESREGLGPRLK